MKKVFLLLLLCVCLSGCAGLADYSISLDDGYKIDRLSGHQIVIVADEPVQTDDEAVVNYFYVPAKVTDVWWNKDYIIAKQVILSNSKNGVKVPPEDKDDFQFSYWLIHKEEHLVYGPLSESELDNHKQAKGIVEKTPLTPIDELLHLREN